MRYFLHQEYMKSYADKGTIKINALETLQSEQSVVIYLLIYRETCRECRTMPLWSSGLTFAFGYPCITETTGIC